MDEFLTPTCLQNYAQVMQFLANVKSPLYAVDHPSVLSVCLSVCLSVTVVRPTQADEIFGNVSSAFGTLAIVDIHRKVYGDRPRGTPSSGS